MISNTGIQIIIGVGVLALFVAAIAVSAWRKGKDECKCPQPECAACNCSPECSPCECQSQCKPNNCGC